jgi:hypothetical protein
MVSGRWAEAASAFRGALVCTPNFRDADKLSFVESIKRHTLTSTPSDSAPTKNTIRHPNTHEGFQPDPDLDDSDNIRVVAECGQSQRASQQGNQTAAELLRDVIRSQRISRTLQRLENLSQGGDGLFD